MTKSNQYQGTQWKLLLTCLLAGLLATSCSKQVQPAPKPQAPPLPFEFVDAWGDKGEGPGKLDEPVAFTVDTVGNVFFADPAAGFIHKFAASGTPLLSFEDTGLIHTSGIAVDSGGAIYVADAQNGNIRIFFPDGTFYRARKVPSQPHFSGPVGITVDNTGHLYVPDPAHSRLAKFDTEGRLMKSWTVPKTPTPDELPSSVATVEDGSVFVAFPKTGRIEKYSSDGMWVTSWIATDGVPGGSHSLAGFAVTDEFVFTLTLAPSQIRVWTTDGQHKLDADLGDHLGAVTAPQIAVTPHQELLVFDPSVPRVFRFRIHLDGKESK